MIFRCRFTGKTVTPVTTEPPIEAGGALFIQWGCPDCDRHERTVDDPNFDPSHPGPHVLQIGTLAPPREWRSRYGART